MVVHAVIVLYNPEKEAVLANIEKIGAHTDHCFVVVNACDKAILTCIDALPRVEILNNHGNIGLSKSLNRGIRSALENGADSVVLFDQDSLPSPDFFTYLFNAYQILMKRGDRIGAVGANYSDVKNSVKNGESPEMVKEAQILMTSGCLIPAATLLDVGLMDETFFIDYIDYEWCFRALSKDYKIFIANEAILHHNLGDKFVGILHVKKPIHNNVIRHYHIIRNQLIMITREYVPLKWRVLHFLKIFYRLPGYIIFSSDRKQTVKNICKGISDFVSLKNKRNYRY